MTVITILAFLVGALFGTRYKVFILVPAIALAWIAAGVVGLLTSAGGQTIALAAVLTTIAVQAGYAFGILTRWAMVASRVRHRGEQAARATSTLGPTV